MSYKNKLIVIFIYALLAILILDIEFAPIIVNALISDIVTIFLFFIIIFLLVYCSFRINKLFDVFKFIPAAMSLVFLIRAIPNLVLQYPPLADPYYHFVCTENIIEFGTTQSHVMWWYYQSEMQLNWPMIHILTGQLSTISGLDVMFLFRFLMPYIGIIFFLGIFALAYGFINNYGMAFLAGLIGSVSTTVIFYQSEYHPQALALTLFVFILIGFFRTRLRKNPQFVIISLIFVFAFTLSHHFSAIFLALISIILISLSFVSQKVPPFRKSIGFLSSDVTFLSLIIITIFGFYIYTSPNLLSFLINWSIELTPVVGNAPKMTQPLLTTFLNLFKWVPIVIVLIASPFILKNKNVDFVRLLIILSLIFLVGVMGLFLFFMPLDRLLAFSMPIVGVACSIALFKFSESRIRNKQFIFSISLIAISITLVASIFGSQSPAYFFQSSEPNSYYWYSNDLPNAVETQSSGQWAIEHINQNSTYSVTLATLPIPFYYGQKPIDDVYISSSIVNADIYVINRNTWHNSDISLNEIEHKMSNIYSGPDISYYVW